MLQRGLAISRERAKSSIMAGKVFVGGKKVDKAGTLVAADADITVTGDGIGYVSRGGLKLAKALVAFGIDLHDKVMADIGASTGGFTDCALQNRAARVFAIDVGYGQLAWSLRTDPRVVCMERTNIRDVTGETLGVVMDFVVIDVAFISLDKVLPVAKNLLSPTGQLVALIKPQFEAGREKVGKKGVVRDPEIHYEVICRILAVSRQLGFHPAGITYSPVKGPEGNIEYLLYLTVAGDGSDTDDNMARQVVQEAHSCLNS